MGTMRLESVNRMPPGAAMGNNGNSFCCSETCHPQYPGLYRLVCFQFFSRIYSAKATSMQSAVFSAIILPNESAMYILTISPSCCNVCWNTSNSVPAVAAKKANASDPLNWRAMVLPTEKTVLLLCVEKVFCSGLRVGMVSCIGLTVGGWMLCTLRVSFSISSVPSIKKNANRGRSRGVIRFSNVLVSSITIWSGIESLYPIAS